MDLGPDDSNAEISGGNEVSRRRKPRAMWTFGSFMVQPLRNQT